MQKQYGAIPYFYEKKKLRVVLITSAAGYWIFPKGQFEKELGKSGTARLEALEEAGVEGAVYKANSYRTHVYVRSGEQVHLTLYPLLVETIYAEWKEDFRRKRKFVSVKEALKLLSSDELRTCLRRFERDLLNEE